MKPKLAAQLLVAAALFAPRASLQAHSIADVHPKASSAPSRIAPATYQYPLILGFGIFSSAAADEKVLRFASATEDSALPATLSSPMTGSLLLLTATTDVLKEKLKEVLDILMMFGFLVGTIRIISGASQMRRGETEEGKASIVSGAMIAAAPMIMRILFEIFLNHPGI